MNRRANIGFDRRIDIEWLNAAAAQAATGTGAEDMRERLWRLLDGVVSGNRANSARGKTVTVLKSHLGRSDQLGRAASTTRHRPVCGLRRRGKASPTLGHDDRYVPSIYGCRRRDRPALGTAGQLHAGALDAPPDWDLG